MRSLITLMMSLMFALPVVSVAEDRVPEDFAIEFVVPAGPRSEGYIEVRCLEGCDWTRKTFACPQSPEECRATVSGSGDRVRQNGAKQQPDVYPIQGAACLGVNALSDPPGTRFQKCETIDRPGESGTICHSEETPHPNSRAYLHDVLGGSPAEQAGMNVSDVLLEVNGKVVRRGADVQNEVRQQKPGERFDALIERDGKQMTLYGRFGIRTSDGRCTVATDEILAAAMEPKSPPPLAPFKLVVRVPGSHADIHCLDGCGWYGGSGDVGGGGPDGLVFGLQQSHESLDIMHVTPDQSPFEQGN